MITASDVLFEIDEVMSVDEGLGDIVDQFTKAFHLFIKRMTRKVLPKVHKHIVEKHPDQHYSYQVVKEGAEATVDSLSPKRIYEEAKTAIKTHGWKIGALIAFWELFEHFILPGILIYIGFPKTGVLTGTLPVGELVFYPVAFKVLSKFKKQEKEVLGET